MNPHFRLLPLSVFLSCSAYASDDMTYVTSVAFQNKALSFDQTYSGDASNKANFSARMPMLNLGFTAVKGKFFVSAKFEKSLVPTSTTTDETNRSLVDPPQANLLTHPGGTIDVDRQDYNISVGYNVWRKMNVFAGYLSGKTELSPDPFCADPFRDVLLNDSDADICTRLNNSFIQFFLGDSPPELQTPPSYYVENQEAYRQEYEEKGWFLGLSYGFPIKEAGTLSLSFAYAFLDGEFKDNANDPERQFGGSFEPFNYQGDTRGTSIALTWTGALGDRTAYTVDLRRQAYSLDAEDQTGRLSNVSLTTDEKMLGLTLGVQVYFLGCLKNEDIFLVVRKCRISEVGKSKKVEDTRACLSPLSIFTECTR